MLKKLQLIVLLTLWISSGLLAQEVVLTDEFDNGDSKWNTGWIDAGTTSVTTSIDNTSKLSGVNSYKLVVTTGGVEMWRIQRISNLPLVAGYQYTLSFMAVASKNAAINALFEIVGDPYTKRIDDTARVTTTVKTFTYTMTANENVADNQVKLMFGGAGNNGATIWIDKIVVTRVSDPALISQWGNTPRGTAWPILNTATTAPGSASMGDPKAKLSGWATIRGTFASPLTTTTSKAVVVTGTFEYVGGGAGNAYTWLRYALMGDENPVLANQNTPTAAWTPGTNSAGYQFDPVSGTGEVSNGSGGGTGASGTLWLVGNANWNSTNTNAGGPLGPIVRQAPYRAVADKGIYNWAISVQRLADGSNEIRYYFEKQHSATVQTTYWFGGTVIDPKPTRYTFNYIGFGVNSDVDATCLQANLTNVKATLGAPITVTDQPWQPYYVDAWGNTPRGTNWPILNTADTPIGQGIMGSDKAPTAWTSIKGGFREIHTPTTKKALIVKGTFEYVGGGATDGSYTWLRYALTYQDSAKLNDQNKTTANWGGKNHWGYEFTPKSGVGELANGSNGSGTVWTIPNSAGWNSTYSGQFPLITVLQAPSRAKATAGKYDWAISVQPLADGSNEIRWYFIKQAAAGKTTDYWFGGSCIDKTPVTTKFNGICFSVNNDVDATLKQVVLDYVQVDMGDPITVPDAPWQAFYVDTWGILGQRRGGWVLTPQDVIGNTTVSGKTPAYDVVAIHGQFPVTAMPTSKSLVVTGKVEFVGGGFEQWGSFRYGIFNYGSSGKVDADYAWTGPDNKYSGYLFFPPSGTKDLAYWVAANKTGSFGGVFDAIPIYNFGPNDYPVGTANTSSTKVMSRSGVYDLAISVTPLTDGTTEIRHYLISKDKKYYWADKAIDKVNPRASTRFSSIVFSLDKTSSTTAMKITDLKVDMGTAITLPVDTDIAAESQNSLPTEFTLEQNYPNPFNPTTTIKFALPKNSDVKLVVYDILGRVVAELVNGNMVAGFHKINFSASNLSSGVYFYSIKAGDYTDVKKLMLMK